MRSHFQSITCAVAGATLIASAAAAQVPAKPFGPASVDTSYWKGLDWRMLGPAHTGRMNTVSGSAQRPGEYYVGTTGGGVWKTADSGKTWNPTTDAYFGGTMGAVQVFEGNPDIVWAGGGEYAIRGNVSHGDGVWKTMDAGKTWSFMGLAETQYISRILTNPKDPNVVYVGALGHVFGPNPERGVYRTKDGGKSWQKVLFKNDSTGVGDMAMDPSNPNVIYAGFWQAGRKPWLLSSGGNGSTMYKTTDGGDHWTELKNNPGLPKGMWGNIGITVSPAKPSRVWAIIEAEKGGVFRSDDAGATWTLLNEDRNLLQRAWYYMKLTADPKDTNTVWAGNVGGFKTTDGGKTFQSALGNGDTHQYWVDPTNPLRIAVAGDPGVVLSYDGGKTSIRADIPTGQYYHVHLTNATPYDVCGAEQDGGVDCFAGRFGRGGRGGGRGFGGGGGGGGRGAGGAGGAPAAQFNFGPRYGGAGGESGYVASDPLDPDVTFGGNYSGVLVMQNKRTGQGARLDPWPLNPMGHDAQDSKYRFQWTFPIMNSPHDPKVLYAGSNVVFRSTDLGQNWKIVSPDLTVHDKSTLGSSGGPLTKDQTSVEYYATVFALAESYVKKGLVWTGSDDGLLFYSTNVGLTANGAMPTWTNITPKDLPKWTRVSIIEPSRFNAATMYFAANRYEMDDFAPYLYRTTDYGKTWKKIVTGIPANEFTRAIREDLQRPGLLYAATERSMYISYDAGDHWMSLKKSLPPVPVHDIALRDDDIVIATMGRGFYAMEGISRLRQADQLNLASNGGAYLYKPGNTVQSDGNVAVDYWLDKPGQIVTLELVDAKGFVVRKAASNDTVPTAGRGGRGGGGGGGGRGFAPPPARVTNTAGLNTYEMSLRYPDGTNFRGAIYWAGNGLNGPLGPPGNYTVRMTVAAEKPQSQPVKVVKDPRSPATEADLVEQFNFLVRIRDTVSAANKAVRTVRNARYQVDSLKKVLKDDNLKKFEAEANVMMDSTSLTESDIYQVRNEAGEDPLNFPVKINNQIGALAGFVQSSSRRPPPQAYEVWNTLAPQLNADLKRLDAQWKLMLPRVNAVLKSLGMQPIVLSPDELGGPKPTFVP